MTENAMLVTEIFTTYLKMASKFRLLLLLLILQTLYCKTNVAKKNVVLLFI